jgi:hypothetical protein
MTKTPFEDLDPSREVGEPPQCEAAFFRAAFFLTFKSGVARR